jgi:hypothetical protein
MREFRSALFWVVLLSSLAFATIFGRVQGLVHDPQHRPIAGAEVTIKAADSDWTTQSATDQNGSFQFTAVPLGHYRVTVSAPGFGEVVQNITVTSEGITTLHFPLQVVRKSETVNVESESENLNTDSAVTQTNITRKQINQTPGADQTNSLAMITDYVPGSYVVHDQLHVRGGHQVEWLIDGVPVPNTNIASNVGPQFDPKDIDYLEAQRGGYSAEYGDRAYSVFNVVTRSGFERNKEAELIASYGSYNQTDNQFNIGSHTEKFAYYGSISGNRSDLGLETPSTEILHDMTSGLSGFGSLIYNKTPNDQLRLVASIRGDHYQVPNTPDQQDAGIRDVENERDDFVNFSWVHSWKDGVLLTVSPFYHFNRAHYIGGPQDTPVSPESDRGSTYAGGVVNFSAVHGRHNARFGYEGYAEHDNQFFGITDPVAGQTLSQRQIQWGQVQAVYAEDQFKAFSWLTFTGGMRLTYFSGGISEAVGTPRVGAALRIPKLGWVLRASWGRYYQPPPLQTVTGPLLDFASQQGFGFLPLRGEHDEQHDFGITIPFRGWTFEGDHFRTTAENYFDHDVLGNSNIFFPLTIANARIWGWEATARSPQIGRIAQWHLAYSHQYAEGAGAVTGGLTDFSPPDEGYFFLDHDQRDTLSTGVNVRLPWRLWASTSLNYGSGFLDGNGPDHLPPHTTFDLSVGKDFGESWSAKITALNIGDARFLLDNSNTFGGTHYVNPREVGFQLRYRFHF